MAKDPVVGPVSQYDEFGEPIEAEELVEVEEVPTPKKEELKAELGGRPVNELRQMAASLEISGRSSMNKEELIKAIMGAYGFTHAEEVGIKGVVIPQSSPHPPMTAEDLAEPIPENVSVRVRRIREASGQ